MLYTTVSTYMYISILYVYISKINAVVSDISSTENPQVNSEDHGKTKTITSKPKPVEAKASDHSSATDPGLSMPNIGSQNTEQVDHTMTQNGKSTVYKAADLAKANGSSTQSGSANGVKYNDKGQAHTKDSNERTDSKKQPQATVNTEHNAKKQAHTEGSVTQNDVNKQAHTKDSNERIDSKKQPQATVNTEHNAKKQAHTEGSFTQNDVNKQAHGASSKAQNITKKQEHAVSSSNQLAEVAPHSASVSHSVCTECTSETYKYDDTTGKSTSSDSKSNTAPQSEKSSAGRYDDRHTDKENQNDEHEGVGTSTAGMADKFQDTDDEDGANTNHEGNFYKYCLIKNIFILAVFLPMYSLSLSHTHMHTRISNVECWFSVLYTLYRSWATLVGILTKLQAGW